MLMLRYGNNTKPCPGVHQSDLSTKKIHARGEKMWRSRNDYIERLEESYNDYDYLLNCAMNIFGHIKRSLLRNSNSNFFLRVLTAAEKEEVQLKSHVSACKDNISTCQRHAKERKMERTCRVRRVAASR